MEILTHPTYFKNKLTFLVGILLIILTLSFSNTALSETPGEDKVEKIEYQSIPESEYFVLEKNILQENKALIKNSETKELSNIFKVEKADRYNLKAVEDSFVNRMDKMIKENNLDNVKHKRASSQNMKYNIFLFEIDPENSSKYFVLSALIYNERIVDEILFFNTKIENRGEKQEVLDSYLKLLLNINIDYDFLPEELKRKIYENKMERYRYYQERKDKVKMFVI